MISGYGCIKDLRNDLLPHIETFARFQAGRFLSIFIDFHGFSLILMDFHDFGVWMLKGLKIRPAAPIETFARFQAGFLSSEDFHRFPSIFKKIHRFQSIFIDFHVF